MVGSPPLQDSSRLAGLEARTDVTHSLVCGRYENFPFGVDIQADAERFVTYASRWPLLSRKKVQDFVVYIHPRRRIIVF